MKIETKKISLVEDTYANAGRFGNEYNVEKFKSQVQFFISSVKDIIDADFDKLNDKELYELLTKVYDISLEEKDYLTMLSKYYHKNYVISHKIATTFMVYDTNFEDSDNNIWPKQVYQVYYIIATSSKFKFKANKRYSKEEIKSLLSDNSVVILEQVLEYIGNKNDFEGEEYELIPNLDIRIRNYCDNMSQFVLDNFDLFGELLRKKVTKISILRDMRKLMNEFNSEIKEIFSDKQSADYIYSSLATLCGEWFKSSGNEQQYQDIRKRLKPTKAMNK